MDFNEDDLIGSDMAYWYRAYATRSWPGGEPFQCHIDILENTIGRAAIASEQFVLDGDLIISVSMMGTRAEYEAELEKEESSVQYELAASSDWPMDGIVAVPISMPEDGRKPEFFSALENM
jgi:hypothetical protein